MRYSRADQGASGNWPGRPSSGDRFDSLSMSIPRPLPELCRSGRIAFVAMSDISSFRYCRPASVGAPCHGVSRIVHGTALGLSISSPRGIMTHLMIARSSPLSSAKRRALGVSTLPRRSDAASIHSALRPEQGASVNWPGSCQFDVSLGFPAAEFFAASH